MRSKLSLWLTGVIVLTILAFLAVFKPITFSPRKDPSDASRYLRPVGVSEFDPERAPDGTFPVGGLDVYVYAPQHDLRLGLDLRGGMRVVLTIPDRITFNYTLTDSITDIDEVTTKQKALKDRLLAEDAIGPEAEELLEVTVVDDQVTVTAESKSMAEARDQFALISKAMGEIFGDEGFKAPLEKDALNADDLDKERAQYQDTVMAIMEARLNRTGLTEVTAYAEGKNRIVLEVPGVKDPEQVRRMLKTTAQLRFMLVPKSIVVSVDDETGKLTATVDGLPVKGSKEEVSKQVVDRLYPVLTGESLKPNSEPTYDRRGRPAVSFSIKPEKADYFAAFTAGHINEQLAIVLDNELVMAPSIQASIKGDGIIEGNFTMAQASELSVLLNAGALPVPVKIAETRTVSATLGADSIEKSMAAGLMGLTVVLIFMFAYYRLPGLMANCALAVYIFLTLAVLKVFDATLTLPGIAGIIISIGMAVDANVIIFERLKEELRTQKPLETALDVAFNRAWTAILDSNVASLITGTVLYALGTGAVKGFAITLLIGVAVSMFTAVTVTRLFMKLMIRTKAGHNLAWYGI